MKLIILKIIININEINDVILKIIIINMNINEIDNVKK